MNTLDLIIPRLYDIAITMGIISVCYALWIRGKYYGEDLTMEENPIKITIDNYCGQRITFTMSGRATVETLLNIEYSGIVGFDIHVEDKNILIEKEDI